LFVDVLAVLKKFRIKLYQVDVFYQAFIFFKIQRFIKNASGKNILPFDSPANLSP
jgi:hypothetical protein